MQFLELLLTMFDGEGGGAGAIGAGGNSPADTGVATNGETQAQASATKKSTAKKNPLAGVVYGKQEDDSGAAGVEQTTTPAKQNETIVTTDTAEAKKSEFEKLIKGDYKSEFDERVQNIINQRFKETKELQALNEKVNPVIQKLASKYGVDGANIDELTKAIDSDDGYFEKEAIERGLTVEQLKEMKAIEAENCQLRRAQQQDNQRKQFNQKMQGWVQESESVKGVYPDFDLRTEFGNKDFVRLLDSGIGVKTAYEVIHKDDIIGGAMAYTAQQVQKNTIDNIRARGARPVEGAVSSQTPLNVKNDVSKLTKKDRAEIARRVLRGETIKF